MKLNGKMNKGLIKKLEEEHNNNELHKYCRDVDYYVGRGMSKTEAQRYVKYWYRKRKERGLK